MDHSSSKVYIEDIYGGYVFEWFYHSVMDSCGDGAAIICCDNPEEVADYFTKWWRENKLPEYTGEYREYLSDKEFIHPKEISKDIFTTVVFADCNENFIFTDRETFFPYRGDISFVIKKDCKIKGGGVIKALSLGEEK